MKHKQLLLLSTLSLLAALPAGAQLSTAMKQLSVGAMLHERYEKQSFADRGHISVTVQRKKSTAKTTAIQSRLYARSRHAMEGSLDIVPFDSTAYNYSPDRGGDLRSTYIKFDESLDLAFNLSERLAPNSRYYQTFDGFNRLLSRTEQLWNTSLLEWVNRSKYTVNNSSSGKPLEEIYLLWNNASYSWDNNEKYNYTYDAASDRLLTASSEYWNAGSSSWEHNWRYTNTYDAAGNISNVSSQQWDPATATWQDNIREAYSYNSKQQVVHALSELYRPAKGSWDKHGQYFYEYDTSGLLQTSAILQQGLTTSVSSDWVNATRYQYEYTADKRLAATRYSKWETSAAAWLPEWSDSQTYDSRGNNTSTLKQDWDATTTAWQDAGRINRAFDSRDNDTLDIHQSWNNGTATWENSSRQQMTYNTHDQLTSQTSNSWDGGDWAFQPLDNIFYYYYEEYTTALPDNPAAHKSLELYPVPSSGVLHIRMAWQQTQAFSVSISDLFGRCWMAWQETGSSNYTHRIDTEQLPSGLYFVRITGKDGETAQRSFNVIH